MAQTPFLSTAEINNFVERSLRGAVEHHRFLEPEEIAPYRVRYFTLVGPKETAQERKGWDDDGPFAGLLPDWYYE